jgi:GNAT superfamily N-acetyltransferase
VTINIRTARPGDESEIVAMIYELAVFELAPEECTVTESQITAALFGPQPRVFCHLAEVDGEPAAVAVWFHNFSTWDGVGGIYLEDLFVREKFRRHGVGRALLATLARECVTNGYSRLSWAVLDWNSPAIATYDAIGGKRMSEWISYRVSGSELLALAGPELSALAESVE